MVKLENYKLNHQNLGPSVVRKFGILFRYTMNAGFRAVLGLVEGALVIWNAPSV